VKTTCDRLKAFSPGNVQAGPPSIGSHGRGNNIAVLGDGARTDRAQSIGQRPDGRARIQPGTALGLFGDQSPRHHGQDGYRNDHLYQDEAALPCFGR